MTVAVEDQASGAGVVTLPPQSSEHAIASALAAHLGVRRLHITDPKSLWAGVDDARVEAAFDRRFLSALGPWCCWDGPGGRHEMGYAEFFRRDDQQALALGI